MKKKNNSLLNDNKEELLNDVLKSQTFQYTKYTLLTLGAIYCLGYVFKILTFTKENLDTFRRTLR